MINETADWLSQTFSDEIVSAAEEPTKHTYTLEEVRAALLEKRKAGFRDEIKALLVKHGADRLTDIDPGEYNGLMADAEAIGT